MSFNRWAVGKGGNRKPQGFAKGFLGVLMVNSPSYLDDGNDWKRCGKVVEKRLSILQVAEAFGRMELWTNGAWTIPVWSKQTFGRMDREPGNRNVL